MSINSLINAGACPRVLESAQKLVAMGARVVMEDGIIVDQYTPQIQQLMAQIEEADIKIQTINATCTDDDPILSDEDQIIVDQLMSECENWQSKIATYQGMQKRNAAATARDRISNPTSEPSAVQARSTSQNDPANTPVPALSSNRVTMPVGHNGFSNTGDFFQQVISAGLGRRSDTRLNIADALMAGNTVTGAEGGFGVPPTFADEIFRYVTEEDDIVSRCSHRTTSTNQYVEPTDISNPWSNGIKTRLAGEGTEGEESQGSIVDLKTDLGKIEAYFSVTNEMMEDAPQVAELFDMQAGEAIADTLRELIFRGSGNHGFLGIFNSDALITVAKDPAQTAANKLVFDNVSRIRTAIHNKSKRNMVYMYNDSLDTDLAKLEFPGDKRPVYMAGDVSKKLPEMLWGKPLIASEQSSIVGMPGDLAAIDFSQYRIVKKVSDGRNATGLKRAVSMHAKFMEDKQVVRLTMRIGGQPIWRKALEKKRQSGELRSPFAVIAER